MVLASLFRYLYLEKIILNLYHILYVKINLKWNMNVNKIFITIKVLKEIIKGNLCDHVVSNFFLDRAPREINI